MPRYDVLLRNDRGIFTDVALAAGLTDSLPSTAHLWLDYDRDGNLDLYVGHAVAFKEEAVRPELRNHLHRNGGDGTFANVTGQTGLDVQLHPEWGGSFWGMAGSDLNEDGWPDLYVSVRGAPNRLFVNDGAGAFIDRANAETAGPVDENSFGVAVGDIDNDGDLDLFQAVGSRFTIFDSREVIGDGAVDSSAPQRSRLLLNLGAARLIDATEGVGLHFDQDIFEATFFDFDNDGDVDLLANELWTNLGNGTFADAVGFGNGYPAIFDEHTDGSLDILAGSFGLGSGGLLLNDEAPASHHWLQVELAGTRSDHFGVGARVVATTDAGSQWREIHGGAGRSQSEMAAHFGLGPHDLVRSLQVHWPSGVVDELSDVPVDRRIRVVEGQGGWHPVEPTVWTVSPPAGLLAGATSTVRAMLYPALFDPQAIIVGVSADLRALGGPGMVPLPELADGRFELGVSLHPTAAGAHEVPVFVEQQTSAGPRWTRLVQDVVVFSQGDLPVWDGSPDGWQVSSSGRITRLDEGQAEVVFRGDRAVEVDAEETFSPWRLLFRAPHAVPNVGYRALRFALHLGDIELESNARFSVALEPGSATGLLDLVDAQHGDWQVVEVPLSRTDPIDAVSFAGTFAGTFYVDAIELVAADLPATDLAIFDDSLHEGWNINVAWLRNLTRSFQTGDSFPHVNGDRVVWSSTGSGLSAINVAQLNGEDPVPLTGQGANDYMPVWSPDGARIAFQSDRDGQLDIFVMNADGSGRTNLTEHPAVDGGQPALGAGASNITWSPDGERIAFVTERDGDSEIYVMDADGANPINLTNHPGFDASPSWSPDGGQIVFESSRDLDSEVYLMNADGSNPVNLTNRPGPDGQPAWSPDGAHIAYVSGADRDVFRMRADGSNPVNLTRNRGRDEYPTFSSDGRQVLFSSEREGLHDIFALEIDTDRVHATISAQASNDAPGGVQVRSDGSGEWRVTYQPQRPLDPTGYHSLHVAFHPDSAVVPPAPRLRVSTPATELDLLRGVPAGMRIDPHHRQWQRVTLPLDLLNITGPIEEITFSGNLAGAVYLDDLRLVAATPRITAVTERLDATTPATFALSQNYPNPFNPETTIRFDLPTAGQVDLTVYNMAGQRVAELASGFREMGSYTLRWDGTDDAGRALASGVYFYRLVSGERVESRKLLLLQ